MSQITNCNQIVNIISHREYTSAAPARLVIYKDKVVFDNPCVQHHFGEITLENLRPFSRNPGICKFMIQLGRFDELGSGVTNINKYLPLYAHGARPVFKETRYGFELIVPLGIERAALPTAGEVTGEVVGAVTVQVSAQVTAQVAAQVVAFCRVQRSAKEIMAELGLKHWKTFQSNYLMPLLRAGILERTIPDKPSSRLQKYRLTEKGRGHLKSEGVSVPSRAVGGANA